MALAQGLTASESALVGAAEASRVTEELLQHRLRGQALQAAHAARGEKAQDGRLSRVKGFNMF